MHSPRPPTSSDQNHGHGVGNSFKFQVSSISVSEMWGRNLLFPITLAVGLYNNLYYGSYITYTKHTACWTASTSSSRLTVILTYLVSDVRGYRCAVVQYLLVATDAHAGSSAGVPWLHLEHGPEQDVGRGRQELDLGVGVKSVQVRALWRQRLVNKRVVADVVAVRRHRKSRSQVQLAVHLSRHAN